MSMLGLPDNLFSGQGIFKSLLSSSIKISNFKFGNLNSLGLPDTLVVERVGAAHELTLISALCGRSLLIILIKEYEVQWFPLLALYSA